MSLAERLTIIHSSRKTLVIELTSDGKLMARAPMRMKDEDILRIVEEKSELLKKKLDALSERQPSSVKPYTKEELEEMANRLSPLLAERLEYFSKLLNVSFRKVTIRCQKTRWGSCSGSGSLNFNCLLSLMPPEVIDSVVAHELCHLKEMNHSKRFYDELLKICPNYRESQDWLKRNGGELLLRLRAE